MAGNYELQKVEIRMVSAPSIYSEEKIRSAKDVIKVLGKELEGYDREMLCVANLRSDGTPINMNVVSMGSVNRSFVTARDVFKSAILSSAASILMVHNHPGGDVTPSVDDCKATKNIQEAGWIMGIPLVDHVVVGLRGEYFSFLENGMLEKPPKENSAEMDKKRSILHEIRQKKDQKREEGKQEDVQVKQPGAPHPHKDTGGARE